MPSEWPDHPDLSSALDAVAVEAVVRPGARAKLARTLAERPVPGTSPEPFAPGPPDVSSTSDPRRRPLLLVAAAVLLVAGLVGWRQLRPTSSAVDTAALPGLDDFGDPTPEISAPEQPLTPTPAEELRTHCDAAVFERQVVLEVRGRPLVLTIEGGGDSATLIVGAAGSDLPDRWADAADGTSMAVSSPDGFVGHPADDIAAALPAVGCGWWSLLGEADAIPLAYDVACATPSTGTGFTGYAFEAVAPPPVGCELRQPVVLVAETFDEEIRTAWRDRLRCRGPVEEVVDGGAVTTFGSCEVSLVEIEVDAVDPWSGTLDGVPLTASVRVILRDLPR